MPYGLVSRQNQHNQTSMMLLEAAYRAGDDAMADKISKAVRKDLQDQIDYYNSLEENKELPWITKASHGIPAARTERYGTGAQGRWPRGNARIPGRD